MTWQEIAWEVVKLAAQALTALVVARLAVRWALSRFKQEKVWERKLAAQSDILVALAEMRRVYGRWIDEMETHSGADEAADREHQERYRAAKRKLEEAMPLAQLLLPVGVTRILEKLEQERAALFTGDMYVDYNRHYSLLDDAIAELVQDGRQLLP
ncbi:hypothetical protein [Sphingomonas aquatilis]